MSDSSYITKLREARTLVASKYRPPVNTFINTTISNNNPFKLPNGFSINPTSDSTVDVNIDGNLNISDGVTTSYLKLEPQLNSAPRLSSTGTLWFLTYKDAQNHNQYALKVDNYTIYDTTNIHLVDSINKLHFQTLKSGTLNVDYISTFQNTTSTIIVNANLLPSIASAFTLGSETNYWSSIYTQSLVIRPNTIHIVGDDGEKMSISYDINKGTSIITTKDAVVESITTSKYMPGKIDANYLPFDGLTFASKVDLCEYKMDVSNSLLDQLIYSIYTLDRGIIKNSFEIPKYVVEHIIDKIIEQLSGNYYVVINTDQCVEPIILPKIKASTNYSTNSSSFKITSVFSLVSEEVVNLTDGDILILYYSLVPDGDNFDIVFGFQNVNFRLPINSIRDNNILNNTISGPKIKSETITNRNLASSSVSLRTLSDDVLNYIKQSGSNVSSIVCLCDNLENKLNKIEKYVRLLSDTYFIKDITTDKLITLDNIDDINF